MYLHSQPDSQETESDISLHLEQVKSEPDVSENYMLVKKRRGRPRKSFNDQKGTLKITLKKLVKNTSGII